MGHTADRTADRTTLLNKRFCLHAAVRGYRELEHMLNSLSCDRI